jgi:peptide/nickel transport system permease protein
VQGVLVVIVASSLAFALLKLSPGDPYSNLIESNISPSVVEQLRVDRGYDKPVAQQYVRWIALAAQGDFGPSVSRNDSARNVIAQTLPRTLWLMALALITSVVGGMALGAWQGAVGNTRTERVSNALVILAFSIPEFWLATVLALVFGLWLHWFPLSGAGTDLDSMLGWPHYALSLARRMFLPWLALSCVGVAVFARFQRGAMLDVIGSAFVRTARAKGVAERAVIARHAFRVALLPVLTVVGLWFPALLGGAVFVEQVFGWPGMGHLLVDAISSRDYNLVAGCVIVGSAMSAAGSLLADLLREWADPRLRV